tara:strand:- start:1115 stop:1717 length:603 start_codon:yes stop_codon:yes gene_type:complete
LYPAIQDIQPLQEALDTYEDTFNKNWSSMMAEKLGLLNFSSANSQLVLSNLFEILQSGEIDMTIFFRSLAKLDISENQATQQNLKLLQEAYYVPDAMPKEHWSFLVNWTADYINVLKDQGIDDADRIQRMNSVNPKFVLRNYLAQLAIDDAENGDLSMVKDLLIMLRNPYDEQPEYEKWAGKRPDWAKNRPGCSMLSCSS